jgi:hypothetical protein
MQKIPKSFANGVEFLRFSDRKPLDATGYFSCIELLRALLNNPDFIKITPGFYLNAIDVPDDNGLSLRLVYYSLDPIKTRTALNNFIATVQPRLGVFDSTQTSRPDVVPSGILSNDEIKFFTFLYQNTEIFLDVIQSFGIPLLQEMIVDYRHIYLAQRVSPEKVFGTVFKKHSSFFRELETKSLDKEYWMSLVKTFGSDFGLHFLVNLGLVPEAPYHPNFWKTGWILDSQNPSNL